MHNPEAVGFGDVLFLFYRWCQVFHPERVVNIGAMSCFRWASAAEPAKAQYVAGS